MPRCQACQQRAAGAFTVPSEPGRPSAGRGCVQCTSRSVARDAPAVREVDRCKAHRNRCGAAPAATVRESSASFRARARRRRAGGARGRRRAAQTPTFHLPRLHTRYYLPPLCHLSRSPAPGSDLCVLSSECLTGPTTESPGTTPVHRLMPSGTKVYHTTPSYRLTSLAGRLSSRCPGPRLQTRATAWPHPAARGTREWRGYGPGSGRVRPTRR